MTHNVLPVIDGRTVHSSPLGVRWRAKLDRSLVCLRTVKGHTMEVDNRPCPLVTFLSFIFIPFPSLNLIGQTRVLSYCRIKSLLELTLLCLLNREFSTLLPLLSSLIYNAKVKYVLQMFVIE